MKEETVAETVQEEVSITEKETSVPETKTEVDVLAKLKELGELKANKVITEAEFKKLKKKLLEDL